MVELISIICGIAIELVKLYLLSFEIICFDCTTKKQVLYILSGAIFFNCVLYLFHVPVQVLSGYIIVLSVLLANILLLKNKRNWIFVALIYLVICITDMLIATIVLQALSISLNTISPFSILSLSLNIPTLFIICVMAMCKNCFRKIKGIDQDYAFKTKNVLLILLCVVFFWFYISSILTISFNTQSSFRSIGGLLSAWISGALLFLICITNLFLAIKNQKQILKNKLYSNIIQSQRNHYETLLLAEQRTRAFRHDVLNHMQCVQGLIKANKAKDAEKYINDIIGELNVNTKYNISGNVVLDIIINELLLDDKEVDLKFTGTMPNKIKMKDIDLCILFSNLLKNALEAVRQLESENRKIIITVKTLNNSLCIDVENSYKNTIVFQKGIPLSRKNSAYHGFGSRNIADIIKKYDGRIHYDTYDNLFKVNIIISDMFDPNL